MLVRRFFVVALLQTTLVACTTVRDARKVQRELAEKGAEASLPAAARTIDLRGEPLSRLVDFAMENRPAVASAALAVNDARLALRQLAADAPLLSETPWNAPQLSLSGAFSESSGGKQVSGAGTWHLSHSPSAALSVDLLLWDFGRYAAQAQAQTARILSAELSLVETGYTVFSDVATTSFSLLEKAALLNVARTNEFVYAEHVHQVEQRVAAGEAKRLDLLRARLDLATAREATVAASNDVLTAGANLLCALGLDASAGHFRDVVGLPSDALDTVYRAFPVSTQTAPDAFAFARTNAPAIRIARARLRAANADVDAAVADLKPSVSLSANLSWTDPLWFWNWGVRVVESVFQGFRKTTAVDRAVVALRQAGVDVDQAEQELAQAIELAVTARDNAQEALRTANESFAQARENLDLVSRQYALGDANRIDFTDAVASYTTALGNRVSAFYRGQRAESALFALLGAYPVYDEKKLIGDFK